MITIVDYGLGNLGSVQNMFKYIGHKSRITSNLDEIAAAEKILLPGVGAFDAAMQRINEGGFREVLTRKALEEKTPILGICLGMQLLTEGSEEGQLPGLGWIPAYTHRFPKAEGLKVPHMGWNRIYPTDPAHPLVQNLPEEPRYYFVHSYYVKAKPEHALAETEYGHRFHSMIQRGNIAGAQFHPEKSHKFGMKLLDNFARL